MIYPLGRMQLLALIMKTNPETALVTNINCLERHFRLLSTGSHTKGFQGNAQGLLNEARDVSRISQSHA